MLPFLEQEFCCSIKLPCRHVTNKITKSSELGSAESPKTVLAKISANQLKKSGGMYHKKGMRPNSAI